MFATGGGGGGGGHDSHVWGSSGQDTLTIILMAQIPRRSLN